MSDHSGNRSGRSGALRVAIADDEPTARATLRLLLARHSDVAVVAECADGAGTVDAVRALRPQLLFLDGQMT